MRTMYRLSLDERGATAVEYALIMAMIFLAMVTAIVAFGQEAIAMWTDVAREIEDARP
jgi:pilus assembly protein Flp/PilA